MNKERQLISFEDDNSLIVNKISDLAFGEETEVLVKPVQTAFFVKDGVILEEVGPGKHVLTSDNRTFLQKLFNKKDRMYHCEVYYVNQANIMGIKWGTDSKIEYLEPTYNFPLSIGACGEMILKAENGKKLICKLVGLTGELQKADLSRIFRSILMTNFKSYVAKTIREQKISIFEIDEHLLDLSTNLRRELENDFAEYGLFLDKFLITSVLKPEDDVTYKRFKSLYFRQYADIAEARLEQQLRQIEAETKANDIIIESKAIAAKRNIEGYSYQEEQDYDIGRIRANKPVVQPDKNICPACGANTHGSKFCPDCGRRMINVCPKCGTILNGSKFCPECGEKV